MIMSQKLDTVNSETRLKLMEAALIVVSVDLRADWNSASEKMYMGLRVG